MKIKILFGILFCNFLFTGCATIIKGYYDEVKIINPKDGLEITNQYGEKIYIHEKVRINETGTGNPYFVTLKEKDTLSVGKVIFLETSDKQILTLKYQDKTKAVVAHRELGLGWLFLDTIFGVYPMIIDMYTGCWYRYEPIDATFE